jgi:hypothetical protein
VENIESPILQQEADGWAGRETAGEILENETKLSFFFFPNGLAANLLL